MTAPIMLLSVLLAGLGVASAWSLHQLQRRTTALVTRDVTQVRAAEEFVIAGRTVEVELEQFLLTGDPRHLGRLAELRKGAEGWLTEAERLAADEGERSRLAPIRAAHDRLWAGLADLSPRADRDEAKRSVEALANAVLDRGILIPAEAYLDGKESEVARDIAQNRTMPGRVASGLLLLGTCGAVAGVLAGFAIARGISRSIALLSVPIRDAAGKLSEVAGPIRLSSSRDIAGLEGDLQRMALEIGTVVERLEQSRRDSLRAEQLAALGQLAAGLAHELRNPLTSMKILAQAAAERGDDAGLRGRSLVVLQEEIARLERSIQAFLDFARPPGLQARRIDLGEIIGQVLELVAPRLDLKHVGLDSGPPDRPALVDADAGQVRQVLLNLILNALDASPEGGTIGVRWGVEPTGEGGPEVILAVEDRGMGLPPGLEDRIFEPFVSTKETGLGLGLSICKRIVEAHGGRIEATDRAGGGARFSVRMPAPIASGPGLGN